MKKRLLTLLGIVVAATIVASGFFIFNSFQFHLIDSSPTDSIYPVGTREAVYFFNKELDATTSKDSFVTTVEPKQAFTIKIDKKSLHIVFTELPKQNFTLTIRNIKSNSGDTISSIKHNYIVQEVPESKLSKYELASRMSYLDVGLNMPNIQIDASPFYKIEYGWSKKYPGTRKQAVYISSDNPTDKFAAIDYIYGQGYDPSDFEIIFMGI